MPNNVNISDYEKIIFVNNISENNNQKDLITDQNYNFAVFFTNNTDVPANWPSSAWGPKIKNIWYGGQRLNRFVGIDQNNCPVMISSLPTLIMGLDVKRLYWGSLIGQSLPSFPFKEISFNRTFCL